MTKGPLLTRRASLALLGFLAAPHVARAQRIDFPNRMIRLVVPYAAGGSTDVVARFIADRLRTRLGETIIVENRPGANAIIGGQYVMKSPPDGYTWILGGVSTHALVPHLRKKPPYDGITDFTSLGLIGSGPLVVSVYPGLPVRNLQELIAYAKANPTKLAYGSAVGVILHLAGEMLKSLAGIEMLHVPYNSNAQALTDVLGGRLQVMFDPISNSAPFIADGRLRPIVVPSARRTTFLPDVPTSAEAGLPGYEVETWFALYGPANMPSAIVERISTQLKEVLVEPEASRQLAPLGLVPRPSSQVEAADYLQAESKKWAEVIRRVGLTVD